MVQDIPEFHTVEYVPKNHKSGDEVYKNFVALTESTEENYDCHATLTLNMLKINTVRAEHGSESGWASVCNSQESAVKRPFFKSPVQAMKSDPDSAS